MTSRSPSRASSESRAPSEGHALFDSPVDGRERGKVNWSQVDEALALLDDLDVVEMANHVVTQARIKGPKEAFNEAGTVRYQLAKVRQQVAYLNDTICSETLEAQHQRIRALQRANAHKRELTETGATGETSDAILDATRDASKDTVTDHNGTDADRMDLDRVGTDNDNKDIEMQDAPEA